MARKKITLAYINKESERKASHKKRTKGLIKKAEELSTLCGIEACAVIYSEFQPQPEVWPSPPEARRILTRFMELPVMERTRLMENQMSFTRQRIEKARNKLRRLQRENKRKELTIFMFQCIEGKANIQDFNFQDMGEMNVVIDEVLRDITERMEQLKAAGEGPSSAAVAMTEEQRAAGEGTSSAAAGMTEEQRAAGEGTSSAAAALGAEEMAALLDENENPAGFSYWNLLMSPIEGCLDWGWNSEPMTLPPADPPSSNPDADQ